MDLKARQSEVVLLFTTYPVLSETFLQREVRALSKSGLSFRIVSLWGGDSEWEGRCVEKFGLAGVVSGILWLFLWLIKKPAKVFHLIRMLWKPRPSGSLNWGENLLGACYGLRYAAQFGSSGVTHCHAVWSSAPAMAAFTINHIVGTPFSIAGHAYDLFERGGDGWMREKLKSAKWARSSTQAGVNRLVEFGAAPEKVVLIRRGLNHIPEFIERPPIPTPVRLLSVGRMVEKMGFERQIPLLQRLKDKGLAFEMTWIGDGPERGSLETRVAQSGLSDVIEFKGSQPYEIVELAYRESDIMVFTGKVDRRGDRAGLPNALAEAMAWGVLVFACNVGAVGEAIRHGENGFIWEEDPSIEGLLEVLKLAQLQASCRRNAWEWVRDNYEVSQNIEPLLRLLSS